MLDEIRMQEGRDTSGLGADGWVEQQSLEAYDLVQSRVALAGSHADPCGSVHSPVTANVSSVAMYGAMSIPWSASQASSKYVCA